MLRYTHATLLIGLLLALGAGSAAAQAPAAAQPKPGTFTAAQFQGLRFLEGDWKGSGYASGPFFETYRFVNDSTIEMTAWSDSTRSRARETSQYVFRAGTIRSGDGKAAVTHIDSLGYHFRTISGPAYGWRFRRVSADQWTATLGGSTVYTMDRMLRKR